MLIFGDRRKLLGVASQKIHLSLFAVILLLASCGPKNADANANPQVGDESAMQAKPQVEKVRQDATLTNGNVPVTASQPAPVRELKNIQPTQKKEVASQSKMNATQRAKEPAATTKAAKKNVSKPVQPVKSSLPVTEIQPAKPEAINHGIWNKLLSEHVTATGSVDYTGLKNKEKLLDQYLTILKNNHPDIDWPASRAKAYWLNAYNAFTVKLILDNHPVSKITDLYGGKPWDVKWIELGDKKYSLNNIEHQVIRPTYNDARIHFAVNCAAASCPPLYNQAFTPSGLDATLTRLTKKFINNSAYNRISTGEAEVSKIFEWYAEDFGDLRQYINKYSTTQLEEKAKIGFKEYDWSLND